MSLQIHFSVSIWTQESGGKTTASFNLCLVMPSWNWQYPKPHRKARGDASHCVKRQVSSGPRKSSSPQSHSEKASDKITKVKGLLMAGFCCSCLPPDNTMYLQPWFGAWFRFVLWDEEEALNSSEGLKQPTNQRCSGSQSCSIRWIEARGGGHLRALNLSNIIRQPFGFNHKPKQASPTGILCSLDLNITQGLQQTLRTVTFKLYRKDIIQFP